MSCSFVAITRRGMSKKRSLHFTKNELLFSFISLSLRIVTMFTGPCPEGPLVYAYGDLVGTLSVMLSENWRDSQKSAFSRIWFKRDHAVTRWKIFGIFQNISRKSETIILWKVWGNFERIRKYIGKFEYNKRKV